MTATIAAFLVFGEVPTIYDVIGSLIIVGGVSLAIYGRSKPSVIES